MGYTHYWYRTADFTEDQWASICKDVKEIIAYCKKLFINLQRDYDDPKPPLITTETIQFNGRDLLGCETFYVTRLVLPWRPRTAIDFCKTAEYPYDLAVCLCLLRMAHHCPSFQISSDGAWDREWLQVRLVYLAIFDEQLTACPFRVS